MLTWFAVATNPRCENRAAQGLRERGFDVYLPEETKWKRSRSKARERVNTPLLTGYLFVGLTPGKSLYDVRLQDGVRGIVCGTNGAPAEIRPTFIYELRARQAAGEFDHTPARRSQFRKGDKAKVTIDGPFKDVIGEVLAADDDGRVKLLLSAKIGWTHTLDTDQLEPVEDMPKAA